MHTNMRHKGMCMMLFEYLACLSSFDECGQFKKQISSLYYDLLLYVQALHEDILCVHVDKHV